MAGNNSRILYIIAGPNGAGKTTFAKKFLPDYEECLEFVNADLIAAGLSPLAPDSAVTAAGRLMLERIHSLSEQGKSFAMETTLSGLSYANFFTKLKERDYSLRLFYLWIPDARFSMMRIAARVRSGGHNVPNDIVRRRYKKSMHNFFTLYWPLADTVALLDNSGAIPRLIAVQDFQKLSVINEKLFTRIKGAAK